MRKSNEPARQKTSAKTGNEFPPPAGEPPVDLPQWDGCELRFRGRLVLRLDRSAPNLILILDAFEKAGWPPRLHAPLLGDHGKRYLGRLRKAVHQLNEKRVGWASSSMCSTRHPWSGMPQRKAAGHRSVTDR